MGRTLLILLSGFAMSFGVLSLSKNQRLVDSTSRVVDSFTRYSSKNAATSGAYMALNRLYLDSSWRDGYSNLMLAGNEVNVQIEDASDDASIGDYRVRIRATGANGDTASTTEVVAFDRRFDNFAVWSKDTVISTVTKDSLGNVNSNLTMQKAPFMPKINKTGLMNAAAAQFHVYNEDEESHFHPGDTFPNGSFYYLFNVPNVIRVVGDLHVRDARTIHGIYIVEGDVLLNENATVNGVLYLPNATSRIYNREAAASQVTGGIVTWGEVDGVGYPINVQHKPEYWRAFIKNYAPDNAPIRVISWK